MRMGRMSLEMDENILKLKQIGVYSHSRFVFIDVNGRYMEMPESCETCPFPSYGSHGIFCAAMKRYADIPEEEIWERRADDCPLVEVEE